MSTTVGAMGVGMSHSFPKDGQSSNFQVNLDELKEELQAAIQLSSEKTIADAKKVYRPTGKAHNEDP